MRIDGRLENEMRQVSIETEIFNHAEGSCLIRMGNTHVVCTASLDETVPPFLRGKARGWITAEYGMLPRSTGFRMKREAVTGKQSGRTQEIQRLIGRALRAAVDLEVMGERQIIVDCDVIQADGGTRCASITGGYVALYLALRKLVRRGILCKVPVINEVAAISCGIVSGKPLMDLNYVEDSNCDVDANFVLSSSGNIIELQAAAENVVFSEKEFNKMLELAKKGIEQLTNLQRKVLGN